MNQYALYGLRIACTDELPELAPMRAQDDAPPDVVIDVHTHALDSAADGAELLTQYDPQTAELTQPGLSRMVIQHGARIDVTLNTGVPFEHVRPLVLGGALALLLSQRGLIVLHGSAAEIGGAGMIFLGHKGAGKSTFTASMMQHGAHLIADDISALINTGSGYEVMRGGTQIRLWGDSMEALRLDTAAAVRVHPKLEKWNWFAAPSGGESMPLKCITVLQPGDVFAVEKLPPDQAFFALLPHYYLNRWQHIPAIGAAAFPIVSALAAHVDVLRLTVVREWSQLDQTTEKFLDVCAGMGYFES